MTAGSGSGVADRAHRAERRYQSPQLKVARHRRIPASMAAEISLWIKASRIIHAISCASTRFLASEGLLGTPALDGDGRNGTILRRKSLQMPVVPEFWRDWWSQDNTRLHN